VGVGVGGGFGVGDGVGDGLGVGLGTKSPPSRSNPFVRLLALLLRELLGLSSMQLVSKIPVKIAPKLMSFCGFTSLILAFCCHLSISICKGILFNTFSFIDLSMFKLAGG
jgi:hypothetical protein